MITLVPNEEEFPCGCGQEDHAIKEDIALPNEDVI
jgi:hypothetical protein